MKTILVTGATGPLGEAIVTTLLNKIDASSVRALVRDDTSRLKYLNFWKL